MTYVGMDFGRTLEVKPGNFHHSVRRAWARLKSRYRVDQREMSPFASLNRLKLVESPALMVRARFESCVILSQYEE